MKVDNDLFYDLKIIKIAQCRCCKFLTCASLLLMIVLFVFGALSRNMLLALPGSNQL